MGFLFTYFLTIKARQAQSWKTPPSQDTLKDQIRCVPSWDWQHISTSSEILFPPCRPASLKRRFNKLPTASKSKVMTWCNILILKCLQKALTKYLQAYCRLRLYQVSNSPSHLDFPDSWLGNPWVKITFLEFWEITISVAVSCDKKSEVISNCIFFFIK